MDVIIVCHTEFGFVADKNVIFDKKATAGVADGVLNLAAVAKKYGAKVSFAVCPEVVDYFPKQVEGEIGLHVHPGWQELQMHGHAFMVGDAYLKEHCRQSSTSTFLHDFSFEEQLGMISVGKKYVAEKLGIEPKFFVAGRWSYNEDTIKALQQSGFTHDCSASAQSPMLPVFSKTIVSLPTSRYFPNSDVNPENIPRAGLAWLKAAFTEHYQQGVPVFHICLHSPCMTDQYFISHMDAFLAFIAGHNNINFTFVSEITETPAVKTKITIWPYLFAINKNMLRTFFTK
ncbi:MAG: PTS alpha-glucoside transporter subunit IIBC [Candidatus Staskawiczbacteria bacterium]|nr:PTS alpha-glucoside transporter subunit IIBC [Candidatus Staskawiczbacteria bacterium]